jgi:hypothetical protein
MRFIGALSQRDARHKARQRNWATKSLQGEGGELGNESHNKSQQRDWVTPIATTSRRREAVPKAEPQQVEARASTNEAEELGNNKSHSKARQTNRAMREPQQVVAEGLGNRESH